MFLLITMDSVNYKILCDVLDVQSTYYRKRQNDKHYDTHKHKNKSPDPRYWSFSTDFRLLGEVVVAVIEVMKC